MKKGKNIAKLIVVVVVLLLSAVIFLNGIPLSNFFGVYDVAATKDLLTYGLDLTGGVYVVLEADESEQEVSAETLDKAIATIRNRIDSLGVKEPTITKQGSNQIRISIPDITNQKDALDMIGKTAMLQFVGPDEEVILTGSNVKNATYNKVTEASGLISHAVKLEFDDTGAQLFKAATEKYLNKQISILLDEEVISSPTVNEVISEGNANITNIATEDEAVKLAQLIRAGALPVNFTVAQTQMIGPTLGQDSLQKTLVAGAIGILLVFAFMLVIYKFSGLAANLSLCIYIVIFMYITAFMKVTITLPGLAGMILSAGMAVDANVIIFERIKEELSIGKTVLAAVDSGFGRALSSIIDSNITTVFAGCALFILGSGSVRGFALTLVIGVIISFLTEVTLTKRLLIALIKAFNVTKPGCFSVKERDVK